MDTIANTKVADVFERYPEQMQQRLLFLRQLIMDTANEMEGTVHLEETLKWGEPSYIAKQGSTIRINCKKANPNQYAMYFNCQTKLVDTFKEVFGEKFNFEGNRAITFDQKDEIPLEELKQCIAVALSYHSRKQLPLLGL